MGLKNKVQLIGNIGQKPEIKTFDNGTKIAKFSLATNEPFKNKDGDKVDDTQWHNVTMFGKLADIAEKYFDKGTNLIIEGRLKYSSTENEDGTKRYFTDVICENFTFGANPKQQQSNSNSAPAPAQSNVDGDPDDLPF